MYLSIHFHSSSPFVKCFTVRVPYRGLVPFPIFQEEVRELMQSAAILFSDEFLPEQSVYFEMDPRGYIIPNRAYPDILWSAYGTMNLIQRDISIQVGAQLPNPDMDHCDTDHHTLAFESQIGFMQEMRGIMTHQFSKQDKTMEEFLEYNNAYRL